ncbi:rhodanese-like domain-containing protein [Verrucomicrobiaceae bacterium 227]
MKRLQPAETAPMLIDIRPTEAFIKGSIPGAINIPGPVLLEKKMNFRNGCILISDGIADKIDPAELSEKLRQKGISADYLFGGVAAWAEMKDTTSTGGGGASIGRISRTLTYEDIKNRKGGVCLVDLRSDEERVVPEGHDCPVLGFCDHRRFHYCENLPEFHKMSAGKSRAVRAGTGPLVVLVAGKDTDSEQILNRLRIEGHRRVALLLGGSEIIARDGRRGKKRVGGRVIEVNEQEVVQAVREEIEKEKKER